MSTSADPARKVSLLPEGAAEYLKKRVIQFIGLVILAGALAMALSLMGYNPADPSWNHATDRAPSNPLGSIGSHGADALIHAFGWAAWLPVFTLLGWAWRLMRYAVLDRIWIRLIIIPFVMLTGAATLQSAHILWPTALESTVGGVVGHLVAGYMGQFTVWLGLPYWVAALIIALCVTLLLPVAMGVPWRDWSALFASSWRAGRKTVTASAWLLRLARRSGDPSPAEQEQRPAPRPKATSPRKTKTKLQKPSRSAPVRGPRPATKGKREAAERQAELPLDLSDAMPLPPLHLLREPDSTTQNPTLDEESLSENARMLESVLADFGVQGEIGPVRQGPVVTRYDLSPAPGTRSSRVINLADDIARSMSAISARVAVVPGQNVIGIELPNPTRETVFLRELLASADFERSSAQLPLVLGKDIAGVPNVADLAKMPHLLVAGTTGSGKSVAINSMILSLLYRHRPDQCRLIMIDPKMLELSIYDGIPHLLHPVVTEPAKAVMALKWAVKEMNHRYQLMAQHNVRNIAGYNQKITKALAAGEVLTRRVQSGFDPDTKQPIEEEQPLPMDPLPLLVVVVDEMADLMLVAGKDIEMAVQGLAQKARAAGIHLIIATQRPSVDVITGTIKANLPTRISFQVTSKIDSRTILGDAGAEQLLGMGDMLYMAGGGQVNRIHGPFVSEDEVEEVVTFLKSQGEPDYLDAVTEESDALIGEAGGSSGADVDALYDQAVDLVSRERRASTSFIQRHFQIGYNRAARIIEQMEAEGIVTPANRTGKRDVLTRAPDEDEI